jgi:hypothetical protein
MCVHARVVCVCVGTDVCVRACMPAPASVRGCMRLQVRVCTCGEDVGGKVGRGGGGGRSGAPQYPSRAAAAPCPLERMIHGGRLVSGPPCAWALLPSASAGGTTPPSTPYPPPFPHRWAILRGNAPDREVPTCTVGEPAPTCMPPPSLPCLASTPCVLQPARPPLGSQPARLQPHAGPRRCGARACGAEAAQPPTPAEPADTHTRPHPAAPGRTRPRPPAAPAQSSTLSGRRRGTATSARCG